MDIPPVNIGPERIIFSCDGVAIKEKDFKYRVRQTSIYVHGVEYYNATEADRYIAHQKYKRCLAMARWCASRSASWCLDPADEQLHKSEFYDKWKHRWLELAEKFKPNN
jgi:hypothetical protein